MKRPRRLRTKKDKKKDNDFQTDLRLDGGDLSEPIISVQQVGFSSLLAEIPAKEVTESFGTIPEYLRVNFSSGEYKVTIRKNGKAIKRMTIAVDNSELPSYGDFNIRGDYGTSAFLWVWTAFRNSKVETESRRDFCFSYQF
jgi:hypothetical protein